MRHRTTPPNDIFSIFTPSSGCGPSFTRLLASLTSAGLASLYGFLSVSGNVDGGAMMYEYNEDVFGAHNMSTISGYCNLAALALLLYETCDTFDREVRHIWQRKVSAVTWIFLLNRYCVLALYAVDMRSTFRVSNPSCPVLTRLSEVLVIITYTIWGAFSSLRTYAIWDRGWHVALIVLMLSSVPVWIYVFRDVHEDVVNLASPAFCRTILRYPASLDRHLTIVSRVCLILSDLLVLSVTWAKTYGILRLSRERGKNTPLSLTSVLLRDGSMYFSIWTVLNALHIAGTYVESIQYLTIFTEAATSILVSRFVLNLREVASGPSLSQFDPASDAYQDLLNSWHAPTLTASSTSADKPAFLAPLGAPLDHGLPYDADGPVLLFPEVRDDSAKVGAHGEVESGVVGPDELVQTAAASVAYWGDMRSAA